MQNGPTAMRKGPFSVLGSVVPGTVNVLIQDGLLSIPKPRLSSDKRLIGAGLGFFTYLLQVLRYPARSVLRLGDVPKRGRAC